MKHMEWWQNGNTKNGWNENKDGIIKDVKR
jgi:hypothetical protein